MIKHGVNPQRLRALMCVSALAAAVITTFATPGTARAQQATGEPIKIGAILAITGPGAGLGPGGGLRPRYHPEVDRLFAPCTCCWMFAGPFPYAFPRIVGLAQTTYNVS